MYEIQRRLDAESEATAIADLTRDEPLILAAGRYMTMRRYAPAFFDAFRFMSLLRICRCQLIERGKSGGLAYL